jgi:Lipase (class 3)
VTQRQVDEFKHVSEWAAAAYCEPQLGTPGGKVLCGKFSAFNTCPSVEKLDTKIYETWLNKGENGATGFVAADKTNRKIYVSMRGSVSAANWAADVKFFMTDCSKDLNIPNAQCEVGFYGFWNESSPQAIQSVQKALDENPGFPIVVTGHSLGGAAAVFGAAYFRTKFPDVTLISDRCR